MPDTSISVVRYCVEVVKGSRPMTTVTIDAHYSGPLQTTHDHTKPSSGCKGSPQHLRMPLVFPVPPLAPLTAHVLAIVFASTYISSIYLSKHTRLSFRVPAAASGQDTRPKVRQQDERWRDDSDVIKARLLAVSIATLACFVAVGAVLAGLVPAHIPNVRNFFCL